MLDELGLPQASKGHAYAGLLIAYVGVMSVAVLMELDLMYDTKHIQRVRGLCDMRLLTMEVEMRSLIARDQEDLNMSVTPEVTSPVITNTNSNSANLSSISIANTSNINTNNNNNANNANNANNNNISISKDIRDSNTSIVSLTNSNSSSSLSSSANQNMINEPIAPFSPSVMSSIGYGPG